MGTFKAFLAAVAGLLALMWLAQGNSFFLYRVFAPATEQVRREVFEESKAYRQGAVQELQDMYFEWVKAAPGHKAALADIILRRAVDVPADAIPPDLREFLAELRRQRNIPSY